MMREQWDAFDTKNLTEDATKDLLRLCGFVPQERGIPVPRSFDEFQELASTIPPPMPRDEMRGMIIMFNGGTHITRRNLDRYLRMGDKLSDEEIGEFFRVCPFDGNGDVTVDELIEFLYDPE